MNDLPRIRFMDEGEEQEVCALVDEVFDAYVAGDFSPEGVREFYRYAEPRAMAGRCREGNRVLVVEEEGRLLGMLELQGPDEIAMLFVDDRGRGLGRALVERGLQLCREQVEDLEAVRVHASLYAVPIYRRLGFEAEGPRRTDNGITYVPMVIRFDTPA
jgi:GNAT superfamily N-acetyltransferase